MTFDHICAELTAESVGVITIARPERLNALASQTLDEMRAAVEQLPQEGARCLLLTGEGRGFSSGADLIGGGGLPEDAGLALELHFNPLVEAIAAAPVPIVAAVNGPAAGAGASIALMADMVVAARSAYFLQAFVNVALVPDAGATWLLPRLVGKARAMEMLLLGERVSAEQAAAWDMIGRVVEDGELMAEAFSLAARLARGPTRAFGLLRRLVRDGAQASLTEALAAERVAQKAAGETEDFRNAVSAFVQKRQPKFEGR